MYCLFPGDRVASKVSLEPSYGKEKYVINGNFPGFSYRWYPSKLDDRKSLCKSYKNPIKSRCGYSEILKKKWAILDFCHGQQKQREQPNYKS